MTKQFWGAFLTVAVGVPAFMVMGFRIHGNAWQYVPTMAFASIFALGWAWYQGRTQESGAGDLQVAPEERLPGILTTWVLVVCTVVAFTAGWITRSAALFAGLLAFALGGMVLALFVGRWLVRRRVAA